MIDCTNYDFLRIVAVLKTLVTIVKIAVPLIIIVMGMLDFFKIVSEGTPEAAKKGAQTIFIRLVAGALIFFLPSIIDTFMGFVNGYSDAQNTYTACINNSEKLDYYKELKEEQIAHKKDEKEATKEEAEKKKKKKEAAAVAAMAAKQTYDSSSTSEGTITGKKYDVSDSDISYIASIALCEVDEIGLSAEVSQMVNRYELFSNHQGSIANYVRTNGFWQCANENNGRTPSESAKAKTKDIIVLGNRTLPPYVDEQDCPSCTCRRCENYTYIKSITTNGTTYTDYDSIRSMGPPVYVQDKSRIVNKWGSRYTYYAHGCQERTCDMYGYTDEAFAKYKQMNNGS